MIIGAGQLANAFKDFECDDVVIFASGVANSNCKEPKEFDRERELLLKTLKENKNSKFVYFSSCALSAEEYPLNEYYRHKLNMENIIKAYSNNYYIFRIPQLFGELKKHSTLINFLYDSIKNEKTFKVYDNAYRYVIEINDAKEIVKLYLEYSKSSITVDIANPYHYKVLEIVHILEEILNKKANYILLTKEDQYKLDLSEFIKFLKKYDKRLMFGKNYLSFKLKGK